MDFSKAIVRDNGYIFIQDGDTTVTIPNEPSNSDYQEYLKYLEEGSN
jgi:hypothetical protein